MQEGPTERTRVRRLPDRGHYDRATVYEVLDAALVGQVSIVVDGLPYVIPMLVARRDDEVLLHGSAASRLMRKLSEGADVCVSVTHLDGLVVATSVFDSSMNYRSAVVFGKARLLEEPDEKMEALRVIVEHMLPGRWDEVRRPNSKELKATTVLSVPIDEASAKIRTGPPKEAQRDEGSSAWAGEIPFRTIPLEPVVDITIDPDIPIPASVKLFRQRWMGDRSG